MKGKTKTSENPNEFSSNKLILPLFFIFCSLILDMISFLYLGFYQTIPTCFLFNIGGAFIFAGIIYIMPGKKSALTFFYIFICLQVVVNILNANIYNVFGDLFSLDYFFLGAEGAAAIRWEFIDFISIAINIGLLGLIIFATVALTKWNKTKIELSGLSAKAFALIFVVLFELCGTTIYAGETAHVAAISSEYVENNAGYLWDSFRFKVEAYKSFGYYGFYLKNVFDFFKFSNVISNEERNSLIKYVKDGQVEETETEFSDDNLIVVLCESHEWFAYDPILTPHIYDLFTRQDPSTLNQYDATVFKNFYGHNKTNVSESIVLSGNMPKLNNLSSLVNAGTYKYAYTLPKLFKQAHEGEKVQTTYFHSYKRTFYHRDPNYLADGMGFDKYISMENYTESSSYFGDWISDANFVSSFWEDFIPSDKETKFLTSLATISTHGPYTKDNPRFKEYYQKYDQEFENYSAWVQENSEELGYSLPTDSSVLAELRRYKVGAMDFDNMIGKIFERLEETGHIDDTTVVLYADHNCYYDNLGITLKGISKDEFSNIEAHHIPLMIYNKKLASGDNYEFCNTYDIFPTICQLYGFAYNKNLVQGYNLFEAEQISNSFFASHLGGMFNEDFFSQNISDAEPLRLDLGADDLKKFKMLAEQYYNKQEKYEKIYLNNLT